METVRPFSSAEAVKFGWDTTLKNLKPLLAIGAVGAVLALLQQALSNPAGTAGPRGLLSLLVQVAQMAVTLALIRVAFWLHDGKPVDLERPAALVEGFWPFLLTSFLVGLIVIGGLILLVVPGVIWGLRYGLAGLLVADRRLDPVESLRESRRLTEGVKGQLFEFWLLLVGVNLLGVLALGVGLLVTVPTTVLAAVHVFRKLEVRAGERALPAAPLHEAVAP